MKIVKTLEGERMSELKKSEKINMEYAEQIVEENQQLRIVKNDLRIENEQLHLAIDDLLSHTSCEEIKKENEQLRKQLDFYLLDEFEWKEKYGD